MKKENKTQSVITFIFTPVAQNTIIRPMAEAVCVAHGGETIRYVDTSDHKEKNITSSDLYFLTLETKINGRKQILDGRQVASMAKYRPIRIRVDVNDVQVFVSQDTTVTQAMNNFYRKITPKHDHILSRNSPSRQHE